jgi:DNA invertase Pin-like site-specific DNA recombinase/DNA-binding winged helix-turn-helix (wHTH) protein
MSEARIPVAEYVRMSTDEQPNSIFLQQAAIQRYAEAHGYQVVATYSDPERSGIGLKRRLGLQQLLLDVLEGQDRFRAILVYDVSRWGRFQDTDESAHYEFICRSAGVSVHYCAEQFENNSSMANAMMKALKRAMAAEYSRELAAKVSAGQRWLVTRGFRVGATPGYGLRRMLVSADGNPKQILGFHERKNIKSDRIILVPGPRHEVDRIREIFTQAAELGKSPSQIAAELNRRRVKFTGNKQWNESCVYRILRNEKYIGCLIWGKTKSPFNSQKRKMPAETWIKKPNAIASLVTSEQFMRVQELLQERRKKPSKPDEFLFARMRKVLAIEGKLTVKLLIKYHFFDYRNYVRRFGSVMHAYELIGYRPSNRAFQSVEPSRKMKQLMSNLFFQLKELFPFQLRIVRLAPNAQRRVIELDSGLRIGVHICRPTRATVSREPRWLLQRQPKEASLPGLICFPDQSLSRLTDLYFAPEFGKLIKRYKVLNREHSWLAAGKRLESLAQLCDVAKEVTKTWLPQSDITRIGDVVLRGRTSTVTIAGKEFDLPGIEAALFKLLVHSAGMTVPRGTLYETGVAACREKLPQRFDSARELFVTNHIAVLRNRLGQFRKRIVTVKSKGYRYDVKERLSAQQLHGKLRLISNLPNPDKRTAPPANA